MNVSHLCDLFLSHAHGYYRKPKSRRLTREYSLIRRSLEPLREVAGTTAVSKVNAVTLSKARQWILNHLSNNCRNTVNAKVSRMVRVFKWGAEPERGYVPELVCYRMTALKPLAYGRSAARETHGLSAVGRDRINDLLASLFEPPKHGRAMRAKTKLSRLRIATMVELQLETGMRSGELCSMTVEAINRHGPQGTWVYTPQEHKTEHRGKTRIVPLFDTAQHLLRRWFKTAKITTGPVFGIRVNSYRTLLQRSLTRAGLEPWTPQQIRHTTGTEVRRDVGIDAAQLLLGHSSVRTTEIYAEVQLDEVIAKMQAYRQG